MAIVCATDLSQPAARAAEVAAALAARAREPLVLVHAYEGETLFVPEASKDPIVQGRMGRPLEAEAERLRQTYRVELRTALDAGAVERIILREAKRANASLLVIGSRGRRGVARLFLGGTAERLARLTPMPILVVRPSMASMLLEWAAGTEPLRIVVGLGLDECADAPMDVVCRLAALGRCRLDFAHAIEPPPATYSGISPEPAPWAAASEGEARMELVRLIDARKLGGDVDVELGRPASTLASIVTRKNAGLLVVGSHGRKGLERVLIGSVAADVLREVPCSIIVAPCDWRAEARAEEPQPPAP